MLGGARKAAGPGYGTKITELMNLHLDLGFSRIATIASGLLKRSRVSSESPGGKFCAQPPKGKYYASNRNYILDLCRDGALEWRLKKGGSMPEKKDVQVVKHGDVSQRVGVEVIKARGVDVDLLIKKLIANAAAEFASTYYYYTILRMHLAGHEDYKEICEDARLEDRAHWELIVPRIYELGGELPNDLPAFHDQAGCEAAKLPNPPTVVNILTLLLESERCAIRSWSEICDMTFGKDPRTYDMAARILNEEVEHEAWFIELLAHERDGKSIPSGHFRRGEPGHAPYSKNAAFYNP